MLPTVAQLKDNIGLTDLKLDQAELDHLTATQGLYPTPHGLDAWAVLRPEPAAQPAQADAG